MGKEGLLLNKNDSLKKGTVVTRNNELVSSDLKNILDPIERDTLVYMHKHILKTIKKFIKENLPYTQGAEGEIYKVPVTIKREIKQFIVIKKRFDHVVESEYGYHKIAENLLKDTDIDTYISVPSLYTKDNADGIIIMDFIPGKTLYTLVIEQILKQYYSKSIACQNDADAEYQLRKVLLKHNPQTTPDDIPPFVADQAKKIKLFSEDEGKQWQNHIKTALELFHIHGLYHRDIGDWHNLRNIIFGDDGKLYIIDFGKSIILDNTTPIDERDIYGTVIDGKYKPKYANDKNLLQIVSSLTKNEEDVVFEKEVQTHKKHLDTISKESSLIDVFEQKEVLNEVLQPFQLTKKDILVYLSGYTTLSTDAKRLLTFDFTKILSQKKYIAQLLQQSPSNLSDFLTRCNFQMTTLLKEQKAIIQEEQTNQQIISSGKAFFQGKEIKITGKSLEDCALRQKIVEKKHLSNQKQIDYLKEIIFFTERIDAYYRKNS